jgi:transcriptional regulator with XRE-family HTH domain
MAVSEKIKFIRQLKGWNQEDMAEKLEMSVNGYGAIERGETNVNLSRLEQIACIFGIELAELVGLDENIFYMSGAHASGQQNHQENCVINMLDKDGTTRELQHQVEKLTLQLESLNKEILARDAEIINLKEIISLLKHRING